MAALPGDGRSFPFYYRVLLLTLTSTYTYASTDGRDTQLLVVDISSRLNNYKKLNVPLMDKRVNIFWPLVDLRDQTFLKLNRICPYRIKLIECSIFKRMRTCI